MSRTNNKIPKPSETIGRKCVSQIEYKRSNLRRYFSVIVVIGRDSIVSLIYSLQISGG